MPLLLDDGSGSYIDDVAAIVTTVVDQASATFQGLADARSALDSAALALEDTQTRMSATADAFEARTTELSDALKVAKQEIAQLKQDKHELESALVASTDGLLAVQRDLDAAGTSSAAQTEIVAGLQAQLAAAQQERSRMSDAEAAAVGRGNELQAKLAELQTVHTEVCTRLRCEFCWLKNNNSSWLAVVCQTIALA